MTNEITIHLPAAKLRAALECADKKNQFKRHLQCVNIEATHGPGYITGTVYITATNGAVLYCGTCYPLIEKQETEPMQPLNFSIPSVTVKAALKAAGGKAKTLALTVNEDNKHALHGLPFIPSEFGNFPVWRRAVMQFDKDAPETPGQYHPDLMLACYKAIEHATGLGAYVYQRGHNAALVIGNEPTDFCIIMPRHFGYKPAEFVMPAPSSSCPRRILTN